MAAEKPVGPLAKLNTENYVSIVQATIKRKTGKDIKHVEILSTTVIERSKTNGFMGEYYTLRVTIAPIEVILDVGTTFVYFVKTLPLYNPSLMQIMRDTGMSDREHNLYITLIKSLDGLPKKCAELSNSWHPHCYFRNEDLLILEDLGDEGYEHAANKWEFTIEQCNATLASLASMHAASLAYEQISLNGSSLEERHSDLLSETNFVTNNTWFVVGLETIAELVPLLPNFQSNFSHRWNRKVFMDHIEAIYEISKPSKLFRNALTHQDLWTSNILFRPSQQSSSSIQAKLIDFQSMRYLPPAADILIFLYLTTRRAHREANLSQYLALYHDNLSQNLSNYGLDANSLLPFKELLTSCSVFRFLGLVNAGFLLPWIRMPDNSIHTLKTNDYNSYKTFAYVRRIDYIVEQMYKDEHYKEIVEEIVCELVEWVYEQKTYMNGN